MSKRSIAGTDREAAQALRRARACMREGQWLSAEGICLHLLESAPNHADALELLAEAQSVQGRLEEALATYQRLLALRPRDAGVLYNRGTLYSLLRRNEEALGDLDAALAIAPRDAAALINRGNVLLALSRGADALASLERALAIEPGRAEAHYNRGNVLRALGRSDEAVAAYRRAVALEPRHVEALNNCGSALGALQRHDEAIECFDRALACDPRRADVHYNRGNALRAQARDANAAVSYEHAIALDPGHVDAHWNLAWSLLALGDYERGWTEHEWRRRSPAYARVGPVPIPGDELPQWRARDDAAGKTLLIQAEQGIGDTLQFLRYVPLAAARGARVVLEVQPALARLCAQLGAHARVIVEGEPHPQHDFRCPIASLPWAFETTLETIPRDVPYLRARPELAERWRARIGAAAPGRRVGLVWAGNPKQGSEPRRGIGLAACMTLFDVPGLRWVSLQVGPRAADAAALPSGTIADLCADLTDFADTAAAIENLDLVITTDTAVAHLAGAMGRPVWVLLMFAPDWRWLRGRDDSPWYPSARLFRQATPGDWVGVAERVKAALLAGNG